MTTPAIALKEVEVRYGDVIAARDINLAIPPGELHVLLGRSGSGKTTLLRALAGFERVYAGQIDLHGDTVDTRGRYLPPERRRVGLVFQDYALFPHLSVAGNVGFGMTSPDPAEVARWLERVGLAGYGDRPPSALSGGEQQRVALARALASSPRLMLFDEPFSNLDPALRSRLRLQTRELLRQEQITAVFVTHDAAEALTLGDRLSVMHSSRLLQSGTARQIYQTPRTREVALSVGAALFLEGSRRDADTADSPLGPLPLHPDSVDRGATLMLRPEQLVPHAPNAAPSGCLGLGEARVVRSLYLGHQVSLELEIHGVTLEASVAPHEAPSSSSTHLALRGQALLMA